MKWDGRNHVGCIPADKQRAFNRVWNHLRKQRARALVKGRPGYCAYLDPTTGHRCAIGVFIPDGHPAQNDLVSVDGLPDDLFESRDSRTTEFLRQLQLAHDHAPGYKFRPRLIAVAQEYGLTYPAKGWAPGPR